MNLENNLNKIKNNFSDMINIKVYCYCYEIFSIKVEVINFFDRYGTLYNYLNYFFKFSAEKFQ